MEFLKASFQFQTTNAKDADGIWLRATGIELILKKDTLEKMFLCFALIAIDLNIKEYQTTFLKREFKQRALL